MYCRWGPQIYNHGIKLSSPLSALSKLPVGSVQETPRLLDRVPENESRTLSSWPNQLLTHLPQFSYLLAGWGHIARGNRVDILQYGKGISGNRSDLSYVDRIHGLMVTGPHRDWAARSLNGEAFQGVDHVFRFRAL